jgi:carboxylesterase
VSARLPLGSDGIARGAQPLFHGGHKRAVLLLHGFGDTPQSLAHLAGRLRDAGWTVSAPLLPGHGRTLKEFNGSMASDWRRHAAHALNELTARYTPVVVCGQSMGAAVAVDLAVTQRCDALALLAPYIAMPRSGDAVAASWPIIELAYPVIRIRDERSIQDADAGAQSLAYGYTTPRLVRELRAVVRRAQRQLPAVRTPTLVVHSREDNRVPPQAVQSAVERIGGAAKALHWMTGCGHVLTADYCKDAVASLVVDWFEQCTTHEGAATEAR